MDVYDKLRSRAHSAAGRLRFDPDRVNEAVAIVASIFPAAWIDKEWRQPTLRNVFMAKQHPVAQAVQVAGDPQIIAILELAEYLGTLCRIPRFAAVSRSLISQYRSTLLQLSTAYRLNRAQVTELAFEPAAADGRAGDIAFSVEGDHFQVECYRPHIVGEPDERGHLHEGLTALLQADPRPVSVAIRLHTPLTAQRRKAVLQTTRRLLSEVYTRTDAYLDESGDATVSVAPTKSVGPGEDSELIVHPDFPIGEKRHSDFIRVVEGTRSALRTIDPIIAGRSGSHAAVWRAPSAYKDLEAEAPMAFRRLLKKVKSKLAQTKGAGVAGRIMVVESWMAHYVSGFIEDARAELQDRVFRQHRNVSAVLLTRRSWDASFSRNVYQHTLEVGSESKVGAILQAMVDVERVDVVPPRT